MVLQAIINDMRLGDRPTGAHYSRPLNTMDAFFKCTLSGKLAYIDEA
jgi:hypothetical protein